VPFDQILGKINLVGQRNDAVVVEEFAEGTEYLIDSYSVDGKHGLVDVCRYNKVQRGDSIGVYDLVNFIAPDRTVMDVCALHDPSAGRGWVCVTELRTPSDRHPDGPGYWRSVPDRPGAVTS